VIHPLKILPLSQSLLKNSSPLRLQNRNQLIQTIQKITSLVLLKQFGFMARILLDGVQEKFVRVGLIQK
jgi:hypothetical protein